MFSVYFYMENSHNRLNSPTYFCLFRISSTMQSSESGRRINQAVASTGKAVAQTGKAVGGVLTSAKGALSNWWSTMTTPVATAALPPSQSQSRDNFDNGNANEKGKKGEESSTEEMETST